MDGRGRQRDGRSPEVERRARDTKLGLERIAGLAHTSRKRTQEIVASLKELHRNDNTIDISTARHTVTMPVRARQPF